MSETLPPSVAALIRATHPGVHHHLFDIAALVAADLDDESLDRIELSIEAMLHLAEHRGGMTGAIEGLPTEAREAFGAALLRAMRQVMGWDVVAPVAAAWGEAYRALARLACTGEGVRG